MVSSGLLTPHIFWGNLMSMSYLRPTGTSHSGRQNWTLLQIALDCRNALNWNTVEYLSLFLLLLLFSAENWNSSLKGLTANEGKTEATPCHLGSSSMSQSSHSHEQMAWAAQTKAGDNIPSLSLPQIHTWNLTAASETCQVKGEELPTWVFYCLVRAVYFTASHFTAADRPAVGNYMEAVKFWGLLSHQCRGN